MQKPLSYYLILARRWAWLIVLCIAMCTGASYIVSKLLPPIYQTSALLIINLKSSSSAYDNISASQLATATYAQLLTSPELLKPVQEKHPDIPMEKLIAMISTKTQPNTSIIEVDVSNSNPELAAQLANEISQNFAAYANTQLRYASSQPIDTVQIVPADVPIHPTRPQSMFYAGIGALVGLALALMQIILFEWSDDRISWADEVKSLLDMDILLLIPKLSRREQAKKVEEIPALAEEYRRLCAFLTTAQSSKPFKQVMVTSAIAGEGKSNVAVTLASFLAMTGQRVLLVDANLRHPTLTHSLQRDRSEPLPKTLLEAWELLETRQGALETAIPTLRILPTSVTSSSRPAELLQSQRVKEFFTLFSKAPFDYIIFDASALLPVADAQILASYVEACLLVIDGSRTSRKTLLRAKQMLASTHVRVLGTIINKSYWFDTPLHRQYASKAEQGKHASAIHSTVTLRKRTDTASTSANPTEVLAPDTISLVLSPDQRKTVYTNNIGHLPDGGKQKAKES